MYPGASAPAPLAPAPDSLVTIMPSPRTQTTTPVPCGVLMGNPAWMGVIAVCDDCRPGGRVEQAHGQHGAWVEKVHYHYGGYLHRESE